MNAVIPPDTNGDVGPNDYVQWVNLSFQIWDKQGTSRYGPAGGNTLWSGFGGVCETTNDGDPIVLYDRAANRWLFAQFAFNTRNRNPIAPFYECVAVSTSGDPTGSYYRYAFRMNATSGYFPDYPKLSVWPDGYYMSTNNFNGNSFAGAGAYVLDRGRMLAGDPGAGIISYQLAPQYEGLLPANQTGSTPPPSGSPGYFGAVDTAGPGTGSTFQIWKLQANFATPGNSSLTGPTNVPVAPYTFSLCGVVYSSSCIPQPGTSRKLDPLADRLMNRLQYRNLGDHESLVASHTVNVGTGSSDQAGMRWYEIRSPNSAAPAVFQQGTFAPADGVSRWMGSVAMDGSGNIALGYSASASSGVYPSIRYTGRLANDPPGQMTLGEQTLVAGAGSQTGYSRWGDYSSMSVDPTDDSTFWYTQEYYPTTSSGGWHTRIGSFKLATPPDTVIDSGPPGTTSSAGATFSFHSNEPGSTFECKLDGPGAAGGSWSACSSPKSYKDLAGGSYTFSVRAVDALGNADPTPATQSWTVSASAYRDAVTATPGLLGYWRLGETSGTTAADQELTRDGSYQNGVTLGSGGALAGDPDTAATFDGVDDRVALPALPSSVDFTVEGWQRITDASNANNTLYGGSNALRLLPRPGGYYAGVWLGGSEYRLEGTGASNVGSWVQWTLVRSGSTLSLYRNGVPVATRSDLPATTSASLTGNIGEFGTSYPAKAAIDEVAVYNAALSAATVQRHYAAGTPPAAPTGLKAAAGNASVKLDWNDNGEPNLGWYDVYRSTTAGGPYTKVNASPLTTSAYTDASATNGTTYYYVVRASDTSGNQSAPSSEVVAAPYASAYRDAVTSTAGLVGYWRLGETSGTTAADQELTRDGSYQNGVTLGTGGALAGDPDTAATFDGVDDRVALPALPSSVDFTVEGWQRITDASNTNNTLFGRYGNLRLLPRPGGYYAGVWLGGSEYSLQGISASNVGSWVQWTLVRSGSTLRLYRNGTQVASRSDLPATTAASLDAEIGTSGTSYPAKAAIDEVAIYNAALSAATVQQHYSSAG